MFILDKILHANINSYLICSQTQLTNGLCDM